MIHWWIWAMLWGVAVAMTLVDLVFAGRRNEMMSFRESIAWNVLWFAVGLGFGALVWFLQDHERAVEYVAGYLIERSLSLDNVFVFALIFAAFGVPAAFRQRVLMFGIVGALVLRVIMIFAGLALLEMFDWLLYVFGAFLIYTGIKIAFVSNEEVDLDKNRTLKLIRRVFPLTDAYHGKRLSVKLDGKRYITPLVAVFAVVATTDLIFALDSIPAIFAITTDPFVVVAANVMALMGMRSLYFLLEGMMGKFRFLQPALAVLLVVIGGKLIAAELHFHMPVWLSLLLVVSIIGTGVVTSLVLPDPADEEERLKPPTPPDPVD